MRTPLLCLTMLLSSMVAAGEALKNADIVTMVQAQVPKDLIIQKIADCEEHFGLFPEDLAALARASVPDDVIRAMAAKQAGRMPIPGALTQRVTVLVTPIASEAVSPPEWPMEIGVYVAKNGAWMELAPEIVYFKTGGVLKELATLAIVKGDINGHVNKRHSPNTVMSAPVHIRVYTPDGVAITEYQLLKLREQGNSREFRTLTGGVFHISGGATRDLLAFDSRKTAPRTYEIVLSSLEPAEYGLLPPPASDSSGKTGRIGKIYSFHVLE